MSLWQHYDKVITRMHADICRLIEEKAEIEACVEELIAIRDQARAVHATGCGTYNDKRTSVDRKKLSDLGLMVKESYKTIPSEFNGSEKGENLSGDVIVPVEKLEQDLERYITLGSTGCRTIAEDVEFNRLHRKFLAALSNTTPYLSQDVKGVYKYEIDSPDELDAGLHGFSDEVTVIVDSGEPGGDPTGEDSFEEYMRQALIEWFDGAKVVFKKAKEATGVDIAYGRFL